MCLPCFPWTWTEYEDPLDSMPEQHVWVHDGQAWSLQRCGLRLFLKSGKILNIGSAVIVEFSQKRIGIG
ncbi:hypothetical protein ACHAQJ_006903 [Trichoderma viride]